MKSSRENEQQTQDIENKNVTRVLDTSEFSARSITVLTACFGALFCTAGFINAFGVFQTYYSMRYLQSYSNFQISWLGSFNIFMFFGFSPIAGILHDKFGPTFPICIGAFFLAQGVLLGFGMAFITNPAIAILPLYFQRNRGLAQGITIAGSSLGGVLWPIVLYKLLESDGVGFGWSLRVVGFIQLPLLATVIIGIRKPRMINSLKGTKEKASTEKNATRQDANAQSAAKQLRQPAFVFLCLGLALFYFGFFAPFFFVTDYGLSLGASESLSIYLISILNAASLFGRILPGFISDRVGYFNTMLVAMFGSALVIWCWTAVKSIAGLVVWSVAYGFFSGAVLSLQFACASVLVTKDKLGVAVGAVLASIALTALFGSPIAGELVELGYLPLSAFAGATTLAGGVLFMVARFHRNRDLFARV